MFRKFSIRPTEATCKNDGALSPDIVYPVLAIDADGLLLIADNNGVLVWMGSTTCTLASIDE